MTLPLWEFNLTREDVSGLAVRETVLKENTNNNILRSLLKTDVTPMPPGSEMFRHERMVLATYFESLGSKTDSGWSSLEQLQGMWGGTIGTLGGHRYLKPLSQAGVYLGSLFQRT
ncbi:hypothetical protein R75461_07857 [Paraburkholderia nemoris]|uniref:hypothetical protein n=1 Tax=Paraburkholderia nemoris TaxID=2793076 RepID=UPI00190E17E2|nr:MULTISPECIES: hypothetical protein [Paraburkholderia]MBK3786865.1 hypothetical protein [Paraburkholderia aspalathi]CAE6858577.1 hypothetical protein R75461_07857 [Paraburkholderia nemoris]